ncbi:ABC transporter ATP-binding protein [Carboxylicivirga sediminis]|uniref:ABC transporter ATP-binding protein n=1 Tax=Carboxylicivirga sediminis TaxID=2006564 RepID=A0A941IWF1_9BACT|nr:ABC transporter ATP-binding protein [Carboxylicivirga sediminis]MBR8535140.1 ABC transporter ATP-binding protein [Carboxylicivirga sediminis]
MSVIQLCNIAYTYPSGITALKAISLSIKQGEKVVLMGSNGSGKSSLCLLLAGVIKPDEGDYLIKGQRFRYCRKHRQQLCRSIGYVFQDPDVQVVATHVDEDVAFGLRNIGLKEEEVQQRITEYLELTGISELRKKAVHTLSYGQKKQVALAGVLAMEPEIVMLDEPFAWLDYRQSQRLLAVLSQLSESGKTVIVSTHDSQFAHEWADRALIMQNGQLKADGSVREVFAREQLLEELDIAPVKQNMSCLHHS